MKSPSVSRIRMQKIEDKMWVWVGWFGGWVGFLLGGLVFVWVFFVRCCGLAVTN